MARFLLLLRHGPDDLTSLDDKGMADMMNQFTTWTDGLAKDKRLHAVEQLQGGGHAVRKKGDQLTVDGPYVEAKEAVVGLYVVEADDYDHANKIAGKCPCVVFGGTVEVRECANFGED